MSRYLESVSRIQTPPRDVPVSRRRGRVRDVLIGLVIALATAALVAWALLHAVRTNQLVAATVHMALPVQVLPVTVKALHTTVGASGTVQPATTIVVTARVTARVLEVPIDLGSIVNSGDLLVALDDGVFIATLNSAKAKSLYADNQLRRMQDLQAKSYGSPADTEKARADAVLARQEVVQAEIDLANTKVKSPAVSVVLSRTVNPGETTTSGEQLFQLGTIEDVMMVAEVSEEQIGFATLGMRGEVGANSFPGETFVGEVVKISANENTTTRTFSVYIRLANKDLRLKPGMTGYARLIADHSGLSIASTAIMNPVGDHATVFLVDDNNVAHTREIRYGLISEGVTEIKDGLQEGDRVVTAGQQELHDGDSVRVNSLATKK
jgi:membrane fusion protein, multidrug efflux system